MQHPAASYLTNECCVVLHSRMAAGTNEHLKRFILHLGGMIWRLNANREVSYNQNVSQVDYLLFSKHVALSEKWQNETSKQLLKQLSTSNRAIWCV